MKRLLLTPRLTLQPMNASWSPIYPDPDELDIFGVVTHYHPPPEGDVLMFALADVNSFYASCERVFPPGFERKADSRPEQQRRERNRSQCRGEALDQNGNSVVSDKKRKVPGKNICVFK